MLVTRSQSNVRGVPKLTTNIVEAHKDGMIGGSDEQNIWALVLSESVHVSTLNDLSDQERAAVNGSISIAHAGATKDNPHWRDFSSNGWPQLQPAAINRLLPDEWQLPSNYFTTNNATIAKYYGAFEFDAVRT